MSFLLNALGSMALILLGLCLIFRLAIHRAPRGCDLCQGVGTCQTCGTADVQRR